MGERRSTTRPVRSIAPPSGSSRQVEKKLRGATVQPLTHRAARASALIAHCEPEHKRVMTMTA
jgi:hypothetical protein